jgi:CRISPR type IV-associated protein Csf3
MQMKPFRIIAELLDGKVATTDGYLPIDSILSYAWIRLNRPDELYNSNTNAMKMDEMIIPDLPIEKREMAGEWYWAASFAVYEAAGEFMNYWHKRFDKEYEPFLGGKKTTFYPQSGRFRSYRMPVPGNLTQRITWYCYGNPDETLRLFIDAAITHIGKKRSQGYGLIEEWKVEETDKDYSETGPGGELMRSMLKPPEGLKGETIVRRYGIRPPYWHVDNIFNCIVPGESDAI